MLIGTWVTVGLIAGLIANKLVIRSGNGLARDLGLGVTGAVIGGWIFRLLRAPEMAGLDVFGLVVIFAGAAIALVAYHTLFPDVRHR